jgi:LemA protein
MRPAIVVALILVAVVLVVGLFLGGIFNRFVALEERVDEQWSQVETAYQRRMDLIPNLVETVKGVADFERETFTAVTEARAQAGQVSLDPGELSDPQALARFEAAQGALSSALSRLLVTVERYPDLRASESFRDLQVQLEGTENRIAVARSRFNEAVREYNTAIKRIPGRFVAAIAGYDERPYFEARPGAEEPPKVEF